MKSKNVNEAPSARTAQAQPGSASGSASELRIIFPTEEAKRIFAEWLCDGGGEQDYFRSMEESATPSLHLNYHNENKGFPQNDKRRYGDFLCDNTIRVEVCEDWPDGKWKCVVRPSSAT